MSITRRIVEKTLSTGSLGSAYVNGPGATMKPLIEALAEHGLDAHLFTADGHHYLHTSPALSPSAGTDVLCAPAGERWRLISEWGADIGDSTRPEAAAEHLLHLYGYTRTRH